MYAVSVLDRKILGFLDDGPLHGYELRRRITELDGPGARLDNASDPAEPAGAPVRKGPRHPNRSQGASPIPGPRRDAPDFSRTRSFLVERVPPICAFD